MITKEEVAKLAKQSRLHFDEQGLDNMYHILNDFLGEMDKLATADTKGLEISYPLSMDAEDLREDIAVESMDREKLLKNAPESIEGAFVVPSVVE